jgi:hypothetical protein
MPSTNVQTSAIGTTTKVSTAIMIKKTAWNVMPWASHSIVQSPAGGGEFACISSRWRSFPLRRV